MEQSGQFWGDFGTSLAFLDLGILSGRFGGHLGSIWGQLEAPRGHFGTKTTDPDFPWGHPTEASRFWDRFGEQTLICLIRFWDYFLNQFLDTFWTTFVLISGPLAKRGMKHSTLFWNSSWGASWSCLGSLIGCL